MFLYPILLVMGVALLQFFGIGFIKATTEEPFSNHVDSSQLEITCTKHNTVPWPPVVLPTKTKKDQGKASIAPGLDRINEFE